MVDVCEEIHQLSLQLSQLTNDAIKSNQECLNDFFQTVTSERLQKPQELEKDLYRHFGKLMGFDEDSASELDFNDFIVKLEEKKMVVSELKKNVDKQYAGKAKEKQRLQESKKYVDQLKAKKSELLRENSLLADVKALTDLLGVQFKVNRDNKVIAMSCPDSKKLYLLDKENRSDSSLRTQFRNTLLSSAICKKTHV